MNRRGFLKCIALTPLVGLLKPKKQVQWIIPKSGIKRRSGTKYISEYDAEAMETVEDWADKYRLAAYERQINPPIVIGDNGFIDHKATKELRTCLKRTQSMIITRIT